jgi:RND family efflux transporter MFP subunit
MKYSKRGFGLLVLVALLVPMSLAAQQGAGKRTLDCVIEPSATVKIGSAVEGILREVAVKRGDQVKKGDVLARLDEELERLTAELAKLRAEVDVEVRSGQTQLNFRRRETKRMDNLRAKKVLAESEHDKAQVEERLARLSVEAATAENKIAQVEHQRAQENLSRRTIFSPLDAVVVDVGLSPGEYVHEQAPLMTIAAVDPLYVEVFVPVAYFGKITKGMHAEVVPEEPVGGSYMAEVTVVDQVFDPASRTFGVRLQLPNPDYRLPAGLRCKVQFPG